MTLNRRGWGFVDLLVTLAILGAIAYFYMKQQSKPSIDPSTQKRLEAQGLKVPPNVNLANPNDLQKMVNTQMQQANAIRDKAVGCAESTSGCSIDASPSPTE